MTMGGAPEQGASGSGGSMPPPGLLQEGWRALGDARSLASCREVSAKVSTNRVYELTLGDGRQVIAKTSSYGSYVHFRQDHQLIHEWIELLRGGRYETFLARILLKDGHVFVYRQGGQWVVFYEKTAFYDFLPKVLTLGQVRSLGSELALFHAASRRIATRLTPSWKSVGGDIGTLHEMAGNPAWLHERGLPDSAESFIRHHCEAFLGGAERLGYHQSPRIPVLVDWNTGNFSVGFDRDGFKLYSRWDYDWFRVEPRTLDFYFCARVVRSEGDQTLFSYTAEPLFEARYIEFLKAYHQEYPLTEHELLFLGEAYRFFILNYVLLSGEHFFRSSIHQRLQREAIETYLPALDKLDFRRLAEAVLG